MRAFALRMVVATILIGTSVGQNEGWNVIRNSTPPGGNTVSSAYVDVVPFFAGTTPDICAAIAAAIITLPVGAVTIDARGASTATGIFTCAHNPFTNPMAKGYTGKLLLGAGNIVTSEQWTMPDQYFWIEGLSMSNGKASALGTVIQAASGFNCTLVGVTINIPTVSAAQCPVVFIAGASIPPTSYFGDVLGSGIRNLTIDCATVKNCVGVGSFDVQEGGGVDTVEFINQDSACVVFDSSAWTINPPVAAISNPFIRNVNCVFAMPNTPPTPWIGIYINATDGPAEISNTTVSVPGVMVDTPQFQYCLYVSSGRGVNINYLHCEHASVAAVQLGNSLLSQVVTGASIRGVTAANTTLGVLLNDATDTTVQDVEMANRPTTGTGYIGPLKDGSLVVGGNVSSGGMGGINLAYYATSSTYPLPGSSTPVTTTVTTDSGTLSKFYQIQLLGVPFASLPSTAPNGTVMFCQDCLHNNSTCAVGGPGALAVRVNNGTAWACD